MTVAVTFKNVVKKFKLFDNQKDKIKDLFFNKGGKYHYALRGISFEINQGEIVGIVGLNGAGKSTLSNLLSGVTIPDSGQIHIEGTSSLIAISSGLNQQLTGLENIEMKGLMLGYTKKEIDAMIPEVIAFADIGDFIHQPVKTYSSGMRSRLGFAISIYAKPDVLVIDEALSVGDPTFTEKCLDKMNEIRDSGKTIFFISHSLAQVERFCQKAIWLHYGKIHQMGDVMEVTKAYRKFLTNYKKQPPEEQRKIRTSELLNQQSGEDLPPMEKYRAEEQKGLDLLTSILIIGFLGMAVYGGYIIFSQVIG